MKNWKKKSRYEGEQDDGDDIMHRIWVGKSPPGHLRDSEGHGKGQERMENGQRTWTLHGWTDGQKDRVEKAGGRSQRKGSRAGSRHVTLGSGSPVVWGPQLPGGQSEEDPGDRTAQVGRALPKVQATGDERP